MANRKKIAKKSEPASVATTENTKTQPTEQAKPAEKRKHTWLEILAVFFAALAFGATGYQGWVSRDMEKRQLRAYVVVSPHDVNLSATGLPAEVTYFSNNVGQTPAGRVQYFGRATLLQSRLEARELPDLIMEDANAGTGVLNPGSQFKDSAYSTARIEPAISQQDWNLAKAGLPPVLVVFGKAVYRDVFDNEHHTWFCHMLNRGFNEGLDQSSGKKIISGPWEACLGDNNRFD